MANGDLGSIHYTVKADTKEVINAEKDVVRASKNMGDSLQGLDTKVKKTSASVNAGLAGVGRKAGQAGIQLQQFIGQIQGGQSAMLALSQQGADLGFVLGAPLLGAVIGIGASLAGMLIPNLLNSADSADKLEQAIERIQASITLGAGGIANYSEEMKRLKDVSEALTRIKLANLIADQQEAMKLAATAINEQVSGLRGSFDTFNDVIKDTFGSITREGISAYQALAAASKRFNTNQSAESIMELERALEQATAAGINNTKQGRELASSLVDLIFQYKSGKITIDALKESLESSSLVVGEHKSKLDELISSIALQAATVAMSDRELAVYTATLQGATDTDVKAINTIYDKIEAYEKEVEAEKERERALKRRTAEEERARQAEEKRKASRAQDVTKRVTGIAEGIDPLTKLQADRDRQLALVSEYESLETAVHQTAVDARAAIDAEYEAKKAAAQEAAFIQQSKSNELIISGLNSLGDTASSVLTGMVTQTMTLQDAARGLANAILNDAVNALVQMGIQYVKNSIISQSADQAVMANKQAMQAVAAAQHTAAVGATVTELASLGSAAAFASTAAIPIVGPALAPAAAAAAGGAIAGIGAPAIAAAPIAGGRLYGGKVNPGTMYPVNENGAPEMFTDGTKQYLMPNARGEVISNKDATSAGGGLNVYNNIVNNSSAQVTSSSRVEGDGANRKLIIDTVVSDIRSGGATRRAITDATTAKNRTL